MPLTTMAQRVQCTGFSLSLSQGELNLKTSGVTNEQNSTKGPKNTNALLDGDEDNVPTNNT